MLEEVWPEIGNAWVSGVLAGGGSILVQWLAPKAAQLLKRLRADKLRLERRLAAILAASMAGTCWSAASQAVACRRLLRLAGTMGPG